MSLNATKSDPPADSPVAGDKPRSAVAGWLGGRTLRRLGVTLFALEVFVFLIITLATYGAFGPMDPPTSTDFISFYAAGDLANLGRADLVYDQDIHQSAVRAIFGDRRLPYYYFFYPPVFLPLCQALARLPYLPAFLLWVTTTAGLTLAAVRAILPGARDWLLFCCFPALFWTIGLGQNALLTAGLLGFASVLIDRRPLVGGGLFALVAYKPHFLLLVPVALACGRRWRALIAFGATLAGLAAITSIIEGPAIWTVYAAHSDEIRHVFEYGRVPFTGPVTVFAAVRLLHGSVILAYSAQAMASLAAAVAVGWLWWRPRPAALRQAGLLAAIPLAAPVVLFYDLMPLAIAIAWLVRDLRARGVGRWEKPTIAFVWLLTGLALPINDLAHLPLGPLAPACLLILTLLRARSVRRAPGEPPQSSRWRPARSPRP